jgi:hypothetical protein
MGVCCGSSCARDAEGRLASSSGMQKRSLSRKVRCLEGVAKGTEYKLDLDSCRVVPFSLLPIAGSIDQYRQQSIQGLLCSIIDALEH